MIKHRLMNCVVSVLEGALEAYHLEAVLEVLHKLFVINALVTIHISAET